VYDTNGRWLHPSILDELSIGNAVAIMVTKDLDHAYTFTIEGINNPNPDADDRFIGRCESYHDLPRELNYNGKVKRDDRAVFGKRHIRQIYMSDPDNANLREFAEYLPVHN
jgi:hypothetical protein